MDGDWKEVGRLLLPPPAPHIHQTSIANFAFDTSQELVWVGNEFGRVLSYYGGELQQYTSFRAGYGPVRQFLFCQAGVITLGKNYIHMAMRRGPPIWHITHEDMKDLQCMSYTSKVNNSEILVAGYQDQMFVVNVEKGTVTKQIPANSHYTFMKRSRYICAASLSGSVDIIDSFTFKVIKTWKAHTAGISDMDANKQFIVTCGYSLRPNQSYTLDALVNVFDIQNMVPISPLPFPAAFVRLDPRMSATLIAVAQYGDIHVADVVNPNTSNVKHADTSSASLSMIEIAPTGEALILGDTACNVRLWGSPSKIRFAESSEPSEFADVEDINPQMGWSNDIPLSTVGMPYYRESLLSSWPSDMVFEVGAHPSKIDPQLMISLKNTDGVFHGPNPRTIKRNQFEGRRRAEKAVPALQAPKFLSEIAREAASDVGSERSVGDLADSIEMSSTELSSLKADVPLIYCNLQIKYGKFGVEDFNFGFYNTTPYSGLENHLINSYANPLMQLMHFVPKMRNLAMQHTSGPCVGELCFLCEMGYLFDMLVKAEGSSCQAQNMLKTLRNIPQAAHLRLLEEDAPGSSLTTMLQGLSRFVTEKISADWRSTLPHSDSMEQTLALNATTTIRCSNCRSEHTRPGATSVIDLLYPPPKMSPRNSRAPGVASSTFSQVLKKGLEREQTSRGWCSRCQRYQSLTMRKQIRTVPHVLMLNAAAGTPEARQFWSTPGCLPEEIGVIIDKGQVFCYQGDDLKSLMLRGTHNVIVYSLIGFVADIDSGQQHKSHLVSLINVAHAQPDAASKSQWHLFNDFLVRPVAAEEALSFNTSWKMPSVITYQQKAFNNKVDNSWKQQINTAVLYNDTNPNQGDKTYRLLVPATEAPGENTIVGIDTEYVLLRAEEIAMKAEGDQETIRPKDLGLGRISLIRGPGEDEEEPFIDDYVASREPIFDYMTRFSGIKKEDLDPMNSKHNVISHKLAYKKLWVLLNLGCIFLGHGLKTDFRVINIQIPKAQCIDTYDLFYLPRLRRRLALKFLAWVLLGDYIQEDEHDSIVDAQVALRLYRKYQEYTDAGILAVRLEEVYQKGHEYNYKVPLRKGSGGNAVRSETPDIASGGVGGGVGGVGTASGPTTPIRRPQGLAPGMGGTFSAGWTPGKGSGVTFGGGSPFR